jgi:2-polyprenyl-6-methoxyphenol hydroxylase-like FAD-dependent oxidoreductase
MRVLIVGGGLAGLSLALCLKRDGCAPLILERAPRLRGEGYMIDFFGSGYDACGRLELLPQLEEIHYPIDALTFIRREGDEGFSVPYPRMRDLLGGRHFNFMRGDLERVLFDALGGERAPVRFGVTVESFAKSGEGLEAKLSDGSVESCDLLVGADGVHSRVRGLAFGNGQFVRELGYHTAAFVFDDPALRDEIGSSFVTHTALGKQVSVYPIRGGRVATFWIHRDRSPIADSSREAAAAELRAIYGNAGWLAPRLLARLETAPSIYFDTVSQVDLPSWSDGRLVLLGDACGSVSLLAGQGASMAVGGAYVLAEELRASKGDVVSAVGRYVSRIKPAIAKKQRAGRGAARWFVPETGWRMAVRDAVLRASATAWGGWLLKRQISGESVLSPS